MSFSRDGREMDRPPAAGSVRRARERAEAGLLPEEPSRGLRLPRTMEDDEPQIAQPSMNSRRPLVGPSAAGPSRLPRPQAPAGLQTRGGQAGLAISRPTQVPQWPLAGPIASPASSSDSEPYRPPPGRSQPPPRPARPSRVPSMLDGSKVQDHTPVFQYQSQPDRESSGQDLLSVPETPTSLLSRPSTVSSVGSIPDFPVPVQLPNVGARRSVTLGPPPSARRGASSFYSTVSYVSPIPEESPRTRSHTSFASSAAMPESWGSASPGPSPQYPEAFYDEPITEEGNPYDDDAEESQLVRSASLGKRGKPVLVTTVMPRDADVEESSRRPDPLPIQGDAFRNGTGYIEASTSSSNTLPTINTMAPPPALTVDSFIDAYSAASATDPSNPSRSTPSPQPTSRPYSRLSAIRRPPKLDIGAVKKAESRGSLTSLPDLIRRATRLAASLEEGRRPASRFDDLHDLGRFGADGERRYSYDGEKHQSGLSDMLAAFPAPTQPQASSRRSLRESLRQQIPSWPLPLTARGQASNSSGVDTSYGSDLKPKKGGRRCCGLPCWGFLVVIGIVLVLITAAIVVPLEFFVIRKNDSAQTATPALQDCQAQLTCQNGGTNVVNQGVCSCICTNGFTGSDCAAPAATGCTMTALAGDTNLSNVTIGDAIPRLIQQGQSNFSISLSPTVILSKFNAGSLSCAAENALVTFDGQSTRQGDADEEAKVPSGSTNNGLKVIDGVAYDTVTVSEGPSTTVTYEHARLPTSVPAVNKLNAEGGFSTIISAPTQFTTSFTLVFGTTVTDSPNPTTTITPTLTRTVTTTLASPSGSAGPAPTLTVTEEILDFARVAVLLVLQEDSLSHAESAQNTLQRVFTMVSQAATDLSKAVVTIEQARNVSLGHGHTIDLVNLRVDTGDNLVGGRVASRSLRYRR